MNLQENSIKYFLDFGKKYLIEKKIKTPLLDTQVFLMDILGFSKVDLILKENYVLSKKDIDIFNNYLKRRGEKEPVQYIISKCEFMGLDFYIDKNVLIPRPDTEILVEKAIDSINKNSYMRVLEIGTGSGCISISLAHYAENIHITATDISSDAIYVAKKNALSNRVSDKIEFIHSDLFKKIPNQKVDLIISNPPYIEKKEVDLLDDNVKNYEPHLALDGGVDGLDFYNIISKEGYKYLKKDGMIIFEIGYNQKKEVTNILQKLEYNNIITYKDYSNLDRVVVATK